MRHTTMKWRFAMCMALAAALAWGGGEAMAGIATTKHNLGSGGSITGQNKVSDTAEICVFCHTPHGSDTSAPVPLWNKKLEVANPTYQTYASLGTSTLDAAQADIGSVSLACLSCHDGSQAMDNIINAPGSGGYDATGGGVNGRGYTWAGSSVDANGKMTSATVAMLGTDLRNDHPVSIQYGGGGYASGDANGLVAAGTVCSGCNDPDFFQPSKATSGTTPIWWVNTSGGASTNREKQDMILYTRASAGITTNDTGAAAPTGGWDATGEPFVECASCHDPHSNNTTFLRISNAGSAVCLACHNK